MRSERPLQQPAVLIAGAVVAACGLAFVAAAAGCSMLDGVTQTLAVVEPASAGE